MCRRYTSWWPEAAYPGTISKRAIINEHRTNRNARHRKRLTPLRNATPTLTWPGSGCVKAPMALRKACGNSTAASSQSALPTPPLPLIRSEPVVPARTGSPAHNSDKMQPQARRSADSGPPLAGTLSRLLAVGASEQLMSSPSPSSPSHRMVDADVLLSVGASLVVSATCRPLEGVLRGRPYQGSRRSSTS